MWKNLFSKDESDDSVLNVLQDSALFEDLNQKELRYLERIVHIRHYDSGEYVFYQNDRGIGMYLIASGRIMITVSNISEKSSQFDSNQIPITTLKEGSFFGETSLIETDSKRTASAMALEPTTLIALLKPDLLNIVHRRPILGVKITLKLAKVLGMRLKRTTEQLSELETSETPEKEDNERNQRSSA